MIKKAKSDKLPRPTEPLTLESLYDEFLDLFYGNGDRKSARKLVRPLKDLANSPEYADSIRAEEVRSLLAEFRGDLTEAIRRREAEIRKIYELHGMSINTPSWELVKRRYDFSDVGDRLDLLALLYDRLGDLDRAIAILHESKHYCEAHGVPFDGQDILDELTQAEVTEKAPTKERKSIPRKELDLAIRSTFTKFGTSAGAILTDEIKSRKFIREVRSRLPGQGASIAPREVKERLLALRKQGAGRKRAAVLKSDTRSAPRTPRRG